MMKTFPRIDLGWTDAGCGSTRALLLGAACWAIGLAGNAGAQPPSPLELTVPEPPDAPIPYLETVVAPGAVCAVVSDVANVLIVGHGPQPDGKETFLAVYPLDAEGRVPPATPGVPAAGDKPARPMVPNKSVVVPIAKPAPLAKLPSAVGAMVTHPKLPLLYVWMDVQAPAAAKPEEDPVFAHLERLLIFSIKDGTLVPLAQSFCRGPEFAHSSDPTTWFTLVLDPAATRLYLPNMRDTAAEAAVGVLMLGPDGMPARKEDRLDLRVHSVGSLAFGHFRNTLGVGVVHGSDEVLILASWLGPFTLDTANRRARYGLYRCNTWGPHTPDYRLRVVGHPAGDTFFMTAPPQGGFVCMMDHSEGYITGVPRRITITGVAVKSAPVLMPNRNRVAFSGSDRHGVNKIYVAHYNTAGRFEPVVEQAAVISPAVTAICASPKFDKLYAAVAAIPEAKP